MDGHEWSSKKDPVPAAERKDTPVAQRAFEGEISEEEERSPYVPRPFAGRAPAAGDAAGREVRRPGQSQAHRTHRWAGLSPPSGAGDEPSTEPELAQARSTDDWALPSARELTQLIQRGTARRLSGSIEATISEGQQAPGVVIQRVLTAEELKREAGYPPWYWPLPDWTWPDQTWKNLTAALNQYHETDEKARDERVALLEKVAELIRSWQKEHEKKEAVIKVLDRLYHQCAVDKLAENRKRKESHVGGGYVGAVRLENEKKPKGDDDHMKLGAQGYKLHISFDIRDVDAVLSEVLPKLEGISYKVIRDPESLTGTQANKFMAIYPRRTEETVDNAKVGGTPYKKVTYYEASKEEAKKVADLAAELLGDAGVREGKPVPNEERLNKWTYMRYGSFTSEYYYKRQDKKFVLKRDLRRS